MPALISLGFVRLRGRAALRRLRPSAAGRPAFVSALGALAIAASACGGGDDGTAAGTPAATAPAATAPVATAPAATTTPAATEAAATATPEARLDYEFDDPGTRAWLTDSGRVNVNFYSEIRNTGDVPIEVVRVDYEISNRSGATTDLGILDRVFPQRIAPGASGAIGATLRGVSASDDEEINAVNIIVEVVEASEVSPLLVASEIEIRGVDESGQPVVAGRLENQGSETLSNVRIAVILLDASGGWIGFAPAKIDGDAIAPGESATFVTNANLPPGIADELDSVLVFAYDE